MLGPILFVLYADIAALVQKNGLVPHIYTDDTQIYGWSPPVRIGDLIEKFAACFGDISDWMWSNRFQLNMWCTTISRRQHHLPTVSIAVGSHQVTYVGS